MRRNIKLIVQYDGTDFSGWQFQINARTVQGEIENALNTIFQQSTRLIGAGRTDAGVHARSQIAHFSTENYKLSSEQIRRAINRIVCKDVYILDAAEVPFDFHSRFNAKHRSYEYRILTDPYPLMMRYGWYPHCKWDDDLIASFCDGNLLGTNNFRSFCRYRPGVEQYICKVLKVEWRAEESGAVFSITADRFFHQMVRGLVGALIDLGRNHLTTDHLLHLLNHPMESAQVFFAPPQGLTLVNVEY